MTSDPDFKVTAFLKSNISGIKLLQHTNRKPYLSNGRPTMFGDVIELYINNDPVLNCHNFGQC